MSRRFGLLAVLLLSLALVLSIAGCGSESEPAPVPPAAETSPAETPAESSPGEALVSQKCTMCHTLDRVDSASYDEAGWTTTIERMEKNGLVIGEDEKAQIIEYLSTR